MHGLPSSLRELFPDADFRFHLTLRRSELAEFFRPLDASGKCLAERQRWLRDEPERHLGLQPEGETIVEEFVETVGTWDFFSAPILKCGFSEAKNHAATNLPRLGEALEPDFALLLPDAEGEFRLRAGVVCFPTAWALEEKLGLTLDSIHGVVPGLNEALASPIHEFLTRLKPGPAFLRSNWGIAASDELNLHPIRQIPRAALPLRMDQLWLRVEHQALAILPRTGGVVFAIRIERHQLAEIQKSAAIAGGLRRALVTMPEAVARYKGLADIREELAALLKNN